MRSWPKGFGPSSTPVPNSFLLTTTAIKRFQDGQNCVYPLERGRIRAAMEIAPLLALFTAHITTTMACPVVHFQ
ncbi:hypothetical protein JTE90_007029 [Oedothorax gibbosus]|uniref:Uncharacterized protein n=1 Tax=Oedothorax gibbosus TaxID=931172 RepID=A0AAV6U7N9_9ARAC|nr:hypothetical protein JTE90_007029 [Oedothorax gibbosus]